MSLTSGMPETWDRKQKMSHWRWKQLGTFYCWT